MSSGRRLEVPALIVAGAIDWGIHQAPGALQAMRHRACTQLRGVHLLPGAGHWVQQEQPGATVATMLEFLGQD
ncbi:MAG: alpha/beta hydrolase, partial [Rhodoferax sp.]|nr:alpha/beta hydrolase [Rhodoferax sp.]